LELRKFYIFLKRVLTLLASFDLCPGTSHGGVFERLRRHLSRAEPAHLHADVHAEHAVPAEEWV
jgi:hypothetical protein